MNILPASLRNHRTAHLRALFSVLATAFALVSDSATAQNRAVKFVAPPRLGNFEGVPDGSYKALAGHFRTASRLDIAFTGISFQFTAPHQFQDVALNQGAGSFGVISSNPGASDINVGPDLSADFNGDGLTDLVSNTSNGLQLQFANGDGTFTDGESITVDSSNSGVNASVAADFDGDGTIDLAALTTANTIVILLNDGHGVFHAAFTYAAPSAAANSEVTLAAGDINGDTLPDLVVLAGGTVTPYISTHGGALTKGTTYTVGAGFSAEIKDVNGDGYGDVIFVSQTGVGILLGSSSGHLSPGKSISNPGGFLLVVADFNKDGIMDLAVSGTHYASFVNVYFGNGNGTFKAPTTYSVGNHSVSLIAGDFYGRGNVDLATFDDGDASLTLLQNTGNGYFQAATVTRSANATGIVAGDFNRDGKQDVAVVNTPTCASSCKGTVTVFPGSGSNFFNPGKTYPIGMHGSAIAAGDLNGDGILDLVVVNSIAGDAVDTSVLLGNADGTFKAAHNYTLGSRSNEVYLVDVNHDGRLDLVTAGGVALGKGDGTFEARKAFPNFSFQPDMHFAVGDVNGDGNLDVVAVTSGTCTMTMQVLQGDGKGGFAAKSVVFDGDSETVSSIALARLRTGGPLDIVYSSGGSCFFSSGASSESGAQGFAGAGDGTFPTSFDAAFGAGMSDPFITGPIVVADFNGDGKPDVGVAANGFFLVSRGNGDRTFQRPEQVFAADSVATPVGTGTSARSVANGVAVADFQKDGRPDVVLTSGLGVARLYNVTPK
jgi:FG-GAP-like repeat